MTGDEITLTSLRRCLRGGVPAIIATAAADGTPNVTYLSTVHLVDEERVALSNQFFSKTSRNLAENPRASVLVTDPSPTTSTASTCRSSGRSGAARCSNPSAVRSTPSLRCRACRTSSA